MSDFNDGGPAFPCPASKCENAHGDGYNGTDGQGGMTLRDWFAAHANENDIVNVQSASRCTRQEARYFHADMMLAQRKVPK